jgi:hypothetical protein
MNGQHGGDGATDAAMTIVVCTALVLLWACVVIIKVVSSWYAQSRCMWHLMLGGEGQWVCSDDEQVASEVAG